MLEGYFDYFPSNLMIKLNGGKDFCHLKLMYFLVKHKWKDREWY